MKKTLAIVLVVALALAAVFTLTACKNGDEGTLSYEITESKVNIGDTHGTPKITATLPDGATKTVTNNLVYNKEDVEKLALDNDNKYTKAGEYTVRVYILEEKDEFYLGEWKITVKITK